MTKTELAPLETERPAISTDLTLSKEDIIAIKVAELESALFLKKEELAASLRENKSAQEEMNVEIKALVDTHVTASLSDSVATLESELKELGFGVSVGFSFTFSDKVINYSIQVAAKETRNSTTSGSLYKNGTLKLTHEIIQAQGKLEGLTEQHAELTEKNYEIRKRLQELPSTERQARAALAKTILNRTEQGKALLAELSNNLNLRLPLLEEKTN